MCLMHFYVDFLTSRELGHKHVCTEEHPGMFTRSLNPAVHQNPLWNFSDSYVVPSHTHQHIEHGSTEAQKPVLVAEIQMDTGLVPEFGDSLIWGLTDLRGRVPNFPPKSGREKSLSLVSLKLTFST